jgi:hypothetical protein
MLELSKSVIRYSWAMSLFGSQQLVNLFMPSNLSDPARTVKAASYPVTQAIENQLNDSDLIFAAFLLGDDTQRALVDLTFDTLMLRIFTPSYISRFNQDVSIQWKETRRVFSSVENVRLGWEELKNNFEVFRLVKNVSQLLAIPPGGQDFDLRKAVEGAYALGQFPDLWAVEGLGHDYTMTFFPRWGKGQSVRGILTDGQASVLPDKSLTMMHAGLGLAFAEKLMDRITPYSPASDIRGVLQEFVTLVKDNARNGYEGAAYESLGLVTRFWHAQMVNIVDQYMQEVEPEAVGYFWHGVGRALYFFPTYFVPGFLSAWIPVQQEPPYELAKLNMIAGLTWATTVVDIRQPQIMESILKYQGDIVSKTSAFTNGVMSALIMGSDITPGDAYINQFLEYKPSDPQMAELWTRLIACPAKDAVERIYPMLKKHNRLGEVFRYQDLPELVARLEGGRRVTPVAA